ncbi:putative calcium-transporting ATPase 13, plasma membrane-type [Camellia lanceoleosa]|uniref:Calcium-transporting ATPase 13, plasma membrane-type n=1 Tax=Camellia lanceoleosa TaxID=1840588 RepID=A0ACC0I9M5_9ERIC|nr:putative calcium-transporting ATPase 13, plasma membrane-type [Camellia lanceoleosa]
MQQGWVSAVGVPGQWVLQQGCFSVGSGCIQLWVVFPTVGVAAGVFFSRVFWRWWCSAWWLWSLLGRGVPRGSVGSNYEWVVGVVEACIVSCSRVVISNTQLLITGITHSPSYSIIDIQHEDDEPEDRLPLLNINQKTLADMIKEKNSNQLHQFGGAKGMAGILETNEKDSIKVGMNTAWGEMMSSISRDLNEQTPLQTRLNKLTSHIGKVGLAVAFLVLAIMMIRYFTRNTQDELGTKEFTKGKTKIDDVMNEVVQIIAAVATIVVVAIPKGLPFAFTLTLAYSMKQMMADHAMVRKLSTCETMGSVTTICTDKIGTLTLNQMKVTEFWLGKEAMNDTRSSDIAPDVLELQKQGVALNTTGDIYVPLSASLLELSGSPTEKALLSWACLI